MVKLKANAMFESPVGRLEIVDFEEALATANGSSVARNR